MAGIPRYHSAQVRAEEDRPRTAPATEASARATKVNKRPPVLNGGSLREQ
jgi:hypothetical protein